VPYYNYSYSNFAYYFTEEADRMLAEEVSLLELPLGLPTIDQIDERRAQAGK
jgi:hypothetical protein